MVVARLRAADEGYQALSHRPPAVCARRQRARRIEMMSLATPVLEDLSRETGESAHFSVPMGDAVVVLARTSGPGAFQLTDRVGVVRPSHCTALGKIMLSTLAPRPVRALSRARRTQGVDGEIDHCGGAARSRNRRGAARRHRHRRRRIRRRITLRGATGARLHGQIIGAIGISGPVWRLSIEALQKRARQVRIAADHLSGEFGYTGDSAPIRAAE